MPTASTIPTGTYDIKPGLYITWHHRLPGPYLLLIIPTIVSPGEYTNYCYREIATSTPTGMQLIQQGTLPHFSPTLPPPPVDLRKRVHCIGDGHQKTWAGPAIPPSCTPTPDRVMAGSLAKGRIIRAASQKVRSFGSPDRGQIIWVTHQRSDYLGRPPEARFGTSRIIRKKIRFLLLYK